MSDNLIKQNINCLENPLWALSQQPEKELTIENERGKYTISSAKSIPERLDMNFLLYFLMVSQKAGYVKNISLSRYEVLKACNLSTSEHNYTRLKESLDKWKFTGIEFSGTFYDNKEYLIRSFGIINEYKINKATKTLQIELNKSFLEMIKHSNFCKYIDFDEYKRLKRPLTARLYELLIKSFYNRNTWDIEIYNLAEKLTLHTSGNCKIYPSHIKTKIMAAINEINQFTELQLEVNFHKNKQEETIVSFKLLKNLKIEHELHSQQDLQTLLEMVNPKYKESETIKKEIQRYYKKHGFDYVKYNILYTNQKAVKAYISYLKQALRDNWGEYLKLQTEMQQQAKIKQEIEKQEAIKLEKEQKQQQELHKQSLDAFYETMSDIQKDWLTQQVEEKFMETHSHLLKLPSKSGYGIKMIKEELKYKILHELTTELRNTEKPIATKTKPTKRRK